MAIRCEDTEDRNSGIFFRALAETVRTLSPTDSDSFLATLAQKIPMVFEEVRKEEEARGAPFPLGDDDLSSVLQMSARLARELGKIRD